MGFSGGICWRPARTGSGAGGPRNRRICCMPASDSRVVRRIRSWPRRVVITVGILIVVLIAVRAAMPYVVRAQINRRLESIPGYVGHVDQIQIHLWRGAYSLHGIGIFRLENKVREPFF